VLYSLFSAETDECVSCELGQVYFVSVLQPSKRKLLDEHVCYLGLESGWV